MLFHALGRKRAHAQASCYAGFVSTRLMLFVGSLICLDVAVVLVLKPVEPLAPSIVSVAGASDGTGEGTGDGTVEHPQDDNWGLCLTRFYGKPVTPTSAAITYLDTGLDSEVTSEQVRSWFGKLDGMIIDVYKLEHSNGRRRISFEVTRGKWPEWERVAGGQTGETACSLVRAALLGAGVGRPVDESNDTESASEQSASELAPSRHNFELIYARRPSIYRRIQWVGTLDHALEENAFNALLAWLGAGDLR